MNHRAGEEGLPICKAIREPRGRSAAKAAVRTQVTIIGMSLMSDFRIEADSMGEVQVPKNAYYGAQTQRAVENFPLSGWRLPTALIHAMGLVKFSCAVANRDLGKLTGMDRNPLNRQQVDALLMAAKEVADGKLSDQFPIDVFQTGSGTSSNMNVNEVISNRAIEIMGGDRFEKEKAIHPNDHVNLGQSSNDTFPTAIHVAVATEIVSELIPALESLHQQLKNKAESWDRIIKIGRTHLMDATPLRLGQEFGGFARQMELSTGRARRAIEALLELPIGGTAVGSGVNTHPEFGRRVAESLAKETGLPFVEALNHFEANAQRDGLVECHGQLKSIATTLFHFANNIRWLGSGPRCGIYEIILPERAPGSSIMPGKVNPVMCESLMQLAARVIGNDQTITTCGAAGGNFQLNVMMPVMSYTALESVQLMANGVNAFIPFCMHGLQPNRDACEAAVEQSLSMSTGLNPLIGYEKAARITREAFVKGKTVRQVCLEEGVLPEDQLTRALDPFHMTEPRE